MKITVSYKLYINILFQFKDKELALIPWHVHGQKWKGKHFETLKVVWAHLEQSHGLTTVWPKMQIKYNHPNLEDYLNQNSGKIFKGAGRIKSQLDIIHEMKF